MTGSHEFFARRAKVRKLIEAISLLDQPPSADDVAAWGAKTWGLLTDAANMLHPDEPKSRPPSKDSIALVVEELRKREASETPAARLHAVERHVEKLVEPMSRRWA